MIEINLSHNRKGFGSKGSSGALDLSKLNSKMVIIGLLLMYAPSFFLQDFFDGEKNRVNQEIQILSAENKKTVKELRSLRELQKQVEKHQEEEKKLKAKLEIVREIISNRKNPFQIMLYISKNIPDSVWINKLKIEKNQLIIEGMATSYKSIGIFTNNLKSSIFFSFVTYKQIDKSRSAIGGTSQVANNKFTENFEVIANISRYE